jgi:hypothetical protein
LKRRNRRSPLRRHCRAWRVEDARKRAFDPAIHPLRIEALLFDGCPGQARA